jgi:hypothetical protein
LSALLSDLLPPDCDDENNLNLFKELCTIVSSIKNIASTNRAHFEVIFEFIGNCIDLYGCTIDKGLIASRAGVQLLSSDYQVRRLLDELLVENISAIKESLGSVWTMSREQKNGQDAFESKPSPRRPSPPTTNECLAAVFSVLRKCLDQCPLFALHLPAAPGVDRDNDMLLRRAVEAAVDSLSVSDPEISHNSILFLISLVSKKVILWSRFLEVTKSSL